MPSPPLPPRTRLTVLWGRALAAAALCGMLAANAWAQNSAPPNAGKAQRSHPPPESTLDTPECGRARAALEAAFDASAKDREGNAARLEQARKAAEVACLGGSNAPTSKERVAPDPPIATPAIRATPQPAPANRLPPVTVAPPPTLAIPQPNVLSTCDATGCFDNNGTRLQQNGTMLSSPRGLCSVQGAFVSCP